MLSWFVLHLLESKSEKKRLILVVQFCFVSDFMGSQVGDGGCDRPNYFHSVYNLLHQSPLVGSFSKVDTVLGRVPFTLAVFACIR